MTNPDDGVEFVESWKMTRREYFAGLADKPPYEWYATYLNEAKKSLQNEVMTYRQWAAMYRVAEADALIAALNEEKPK